MKNSFCKAERLDSKLIIDKLFAGGNSSMAAFPLRVVYMKLDKDASLPPVSVLISVPKKRFHHAVDRNRMKRLVREAYRTQKGILWKALEDKDYRIAMAFICITDKMPSFSQVNKSISKALVRVAEKI
ncbi:MAG: ribonuclease P protein component [Bacteroidaceae bacterium]|nr:ribonuclease P protein component [Bacteroidaceae bacterium]